MYRVLCAIALLFTGAVVSRADDLPPDAAEVVKAFEQESEQIRTRIEAEVCVKREALIQQLQAMQDTYTRNAKLDEAVIIRNTIRDLRRAGLTPLADPGSLTSYRGENGKVLLFEVVGSTDGSIYGTDIYTDDSDLSTAAVHANILKPNEKGFVKVTILPGQDSYVSTSRNGLESYSYNAWSGSYKIEALHGAVATKPPVPTTSITFTTTTLTDPGSLWEYQNKIGQTFTFQVCGSTNNGTIWGTGIYTGDSPLSVAAVHSGILKDGETGLVKVTILAGDTRYLGTVRNGVTSSDYHAYPFSYRVDPINPVVQPEVQDSYPSRIRLYPTPLKSTNFSTYYNFKRK